MLIVNLRWLKKIVCCLIWWATAISCDDFSLALHFREHGVRWLPAANCGQTSCCEAPLPGSGPRLWAEGAGYRDGKDWPQVWLCPGNLLPDASDDQEEKGEDKTGQPEEICAET